MLDELYGWVERRVWGRWVPMSKAQIQDLPLSVLRELQEQLATNPLKPIRYSRPLDFWHHGARLHAVGDMGFCGQCDYKVYAVHGDTN